MDPNRRRRTRKLEHEAGTATPDPELAKLTDAELVREYQRETSGEAEAERQRAATEKADPWLGYLKNMTDEELLREYEQALAAENAAQAELARRRPTQPEPPAPVIAAPPVEPHPIALESASEDTTTRQVEAAMAETDPRTRWRMEQALAMAEAVRVAKEDGERQARSAHEQGREHPGERIGAGELVDMLHKEREP